MTEPPRPAIVPLVNNRVVAVDGGTGTGKSRLGDELAQLLRRKGTPALFISTGHLYRAVAWVMLEAARAHQPRRRGQADTAYAQAVVQAVRRMDEAAMLAAAKDHQLAMHLGEVWLDEQPVSVEMQLKGPGVGLVVPHVAGFLGVRELVGVAVRRQVNEFDGFVIVEGRDIAHSVLPEAPLRLLLTVSPEVAAQRSVEHTVAEIIARDQADRAHEHGALKHPDDDHNYLEVIATDGHTPETIRDYVYGLLRQVFPVLPAAD